MVLHSGMLVYNSILLGIRNLMNTDSSSFAQYVWNVATVANESVK